MKQIEIEVQFILSRCFNGEIVTMDDGFVEGLFKLIENTLAAERADAKREAATCIGRPPDYDKCPGLSPAVLCGECVKEERADAVKGLHVHRCECADMDNPRIISTDPLCLAARKEAADGR